MDKKSLVLVIMDGFGISQDLRGNAVKNAYTPNLDYMFKNCPYTEIVASGIEVGLPENQMGNSEVGHMNIGAGRTVFQDLTYIDQCIKNGSFNKNNRLCGIMEYVSEKKSSLHIMGLISDGGIHSSLNHLYALLKLASNYKIKNVYIHAWTDGRDAPIRSAIKYISDLENFISEVKVGEIKTVSGRFYSMDRDKRFERTKLSYESIVYGKGRKFESVSEYLNEEYISGNTDEFIIPAVKNGYNGISKDDVLVCFNFRSDRARQISDLFLNEDNIKYFGFCKYKENVPSIFEPREIKNTIGQYLSDVGKTQLRVAETEKYAHITFFLNSGAEKPFENEDRVIIDSPKVKTYDLMPEMSADEITNCVIKAMNSRKYDVIFVNYANPDMVGHTGNFNATVKAIEKVDKCIGKLKFESQKNGSVLIVTADHGNAEKMIDEKGEIFTSHTTNLVPFTIFGYNCKLKKIGALCDVSPTVLEILKLKKPAEMTGQSLII